MVVVFVSSESEKKKERKKIDRQTDITIEIEKD